MQTQKFQRKTFVVDAVQVTEENMEEVAKWCRGTIETTDSKIAEGLHQEPQRYIKVNVLNPYNPRQTQAFVDDWVLYARDNFKVYMDKGFNKTFEAVYKEQEAAAAPYQGNVKKQEEQVVHRSAESGQFVTENEADENPSTTVTETVTHSPIPTPPPAKTVTVHD